MVSTKLGFFLNQIKLIDSFLKQSKTRKYSISNVTNQIIHLDEVNTTIYF